MALPNNRRDRKTLEPIIEAHIKPGTTIISDCWKAYDHLGAAGFQHLTCSEPQHELRGPDHRGPHQHCGKLVVAGKTAAAIDAHLTRKLDIAPVRVNLAASLGLRPSQAFRVLPECGEPPVHYRLGAAGMQWLHSVSQLEVSRNTHARFAGASSTTV